jgi:hypothetical protein
MNEPESKKTSIRHYLYLYRLVAPEIGTKVDPGDPTHRDVPGYVELLAQDLLDLKKSGGKCRKNDRPLAQSHKTFLFRKLSMFVVS